MSLDPKIADPLNPRAEHLDLRTRLKSGLMMDTVLNKAFTSAGRENEGGDADGSTVKNRATVLRTRICIKKSTFLYSLFMQPLSQQHKL